MIYILLVTRKNNNECTDSFIIALDSGVLRGGTSDTLNKITDYEIQVTKKEMNKHKALVKQLEQNCFSNIGVVTSNTFEQVSKSYAFYEVNKDLIELKNKTHIKNIDTGEVKKIKWID